VWICSFTKSACFAPAAHARTTHRRGAHSTPEQAGTEFSRIAPKLAVYSHFSLFATPEPTVDELVEQTRRTYKRPLVVGEDLMAFVIGDSIAVQRAR
jgi:ribonuclease Z